MSHLKIFAAYVFSIFWGLVLGYALDLYQPFQVQHQILVKIGYKGGRQIEQPADIIAILKRKEYVTRALDDDIKANLFWKNSGEAGPYRFTVKANKMSDVVAISITRRYFQVDPPNFDVSDALIKIAHSLKSDQDVIFDSIDSEIIRKYENFAKSSRSPIIGGFGDGYQQRAQVIGGVDVVKNRLFLTWQCYVLMIVICVVVAQIFIYLKSK